jgi:5,10-methylenetetrahydromethanopterin reductase
MDELKISFCILPDGDVEEILDTIELGDRLGFHGVYLADEIFHHDAWALLAASAARTERIRLIVTSHVVLKQPSYMAQQLLTLDALSHGRAEALYSVGTLPMLEQHGVDLASLKIIGRLREAHVILRSFLDTGRVTMDGRFFRYSGLFTSARGYQERIPLSMGGIRGPKTFELAGEVADGLMTGLAYSEEALAYARDHFQRGAARAGRDWRTLDLAAGLIGTIAEDGDAAREVARVVAAFYIPAMGDAAAQRHGIDPERLVPIREAFARGDVEQAVRLAPPDITDRLIMPVGTPEEVIEQMNVLGPLRYNHAAITPIDAQMVRRIGDFDIPEVPRVAEQLQLLHDRVLPHVRARSIAPLPIAETP